MNEPELKLIGHLPDGSEVFYESDIREIFIHHHEGDPWGWVRMIPDRILNYEFRECLNSLRETALLRIREPEVKS